jgi:hypothetical protein
MFIFIARRKISSDWKQFLVSPREARVFLKIAHSAIFRSGGAHQSLQLRRRRRLPIMLHIMRKLLAPARSAD